MDFSQFLEAKVRSSKSQCIVSMVHALIGVFEQYDLDTRRLAWHKLTSGEGEIQLNKLLRSPSQPVSMSNFVKLVEKH
jgi:hypothetical protein